MPSIFELPNASEIFINNNEEIFKNLFKISSYFYREVGRGFLNGEIMSPDEYKIILPQYAADKLSYIPFDIDSNPRISFDTHFEERKAFKDLLESLLKLFPDKIKQYNPRNEGAIVLFISGSGQIPGVEEDTFYFNIFTRKGLKRD